jgi:hypothetical protein
MSGEQHYGFKTACCNQRFIFNLTLVSPVKSGTLIDSDDEFRSGQKSVHFPIAACRAPNKTNEWGELSAYRPPTTILQFLERVTGTVSLLLSALSTFQKLSLAEFKWRSSTVRDQIVKAHL